MSCSAASAGQSVPVYNIHVQLDVVSQEKRRACGTPARSIQVPEIMTHTIMMGVQNERNAVNLLNHSKVKITLQR
jgi:hypothetical protein